MKVSLLKSIPLLVLLLVGCTEDPSSKPDDPNNPANAQLTLSVAELNYSDGGGSQSVVVRSNVSWSVSGTNDWCTIDHADGSYDGEIRVTTQPNAGYDDRSMNLTVKAGGVTRILTINQRKKDALTLTQARYEIRQGGEVIAVEVKHNIDFTVHIPQEFAGWIIPVTTKGLASSSLQFDIAANPGYDPREGKIIIRNSDGSLADTLYIVQAQLDKLGLTEQRRTVVPEGGTVTVAVNTNLDYDIIIPETASWIRLAPQTKGLRQEEYTFSVDAHTGFNSRSAEIVFKDRNTSTADTLYILQASYKANVTLSESQTLRSILSDEEMKIIKELTLQGHLSDADFAIMRDKMPGLTNLDLYATDCLRIPYQAFCELKNGHFVGHPSLTHIILPQGATHIENSAFEDCRALQSIHLPKTFAPIAEDANSGILAGLLQSITVEAGHPTYSDIDGVLFSANKERLIWYPTARTASIYAVPDGVLTVDNCYSPNLISVFIPASVISIQGSAFGLKTSISIDAANTAYCDVDGILFSKDRQTIVRYPNAKGTSYSIPNGVITIGESAFSGTDLTTINIPMSVTTIGSRAFSGTQMTTIDIPLSVTAIGGGTFVGSQLTTIDIPSSVTTIGSAAFAACPRLTTVNIQQGVTMIEAQTFRNCWQLSSVTLPNSITKIGTGAFMQSGLTHLVIPEGVTEFGSALCQECKQLTSVVLPSTLVSLSSDNWGPFVACPQLTSITCYATIPPKGGLGLGISGPTTPVPVYVPAASVEAYKAAPGWNKFTNIQPITD